MWRFFLSAIIGFCLLSACEEPTPLMTGRLNKPSDVKAFLGCPQSFPECNLETESSHLLLVVNSGGNELKIFDADGRSFFSAPNPLFSFSIPVGLNPRNVALDPYQEFAFVVNSISEDVSVVDLNPQKLCEVDTDWDTSTCAPALDPLSDRCRVGVSRVVLGNNERIFPEDVVTPRESAQEEKTWDRSQQLPVYVSISGKGQIAVLQFSYPGLAPGWEQRMDLDRIIDVGGQPSGMALTKDGNQLFVADEASSSIVWIETKTQNIERIDVGGPSTRVRLTPDEKVLYVIRPDQGRITLVDVITRTIMPPGSTIPNATDPENNSGDIQLPGIPRSITFVQGIKVSISDENGSPKVYTTELLTSKELAERTTQDPNYSEHTVKTFGFVSNMDGSTYFIDAENHRVVDQFPFLGPNSGPVILKEDNTTISIDDLLLCVELGNCQYPFLAEFDKTNGENTEETLCRKFANEDVERCVYHGIYVKPGITRSENWALTWEGVIPGTNQSTSGRLGNWNLQDDRLGLDFLAAGAVSGDSLEILSQPPNLDVGAEDHPCFPGSGNQESSQLQSIFTIETIGANNVQLKPVEGMDLAKCWSEAVHYQIRAKGAWIVWASESGIQPRLQMIPWQDPPPEIPAYDNGLIALTLFSPNSNQTPSIPQDAVYSFSTDDGFSNTRFVPTIKAGIADSLISIDLDNDLEAGTPGDDRVFLFYEGSNAMIEFFPENLDSANYILYQ